MKKTDSDLLTILISISTISLVYLWTIPRSVVLEDDGFFAIAAYFNGVTHPPGYPLFVMISHVFTWLPVGSIAFRVHLASAFFGVLACSALWFLTRYLFKERVLAVFTALGLAFSTTFWSQAIIAEVYTLNVFLFLLLINIALRITEVDTAKRHTYLIWLVFCYGLALSNHWPLVVLSTPALLVLIWPLREYLYRNCYRYLIYLVPGLLPYVWLVWRSHAVPEISFYGPIEGFGDFWNYISRKEYSTVDYSITADLWDKLKFCGFILSETARQFGYFGIILVVTGFIMQWNRWPARWAVSMTLAYMGSTFFIIFLRNADYELFTRVTFQVYPLISYAVCWIWAALGLSVFVYKLSDLSRNKIDPAVFSGAISMLFIVILLLMNININNRRDDLMADEYGRLVLDTLEPNSVFYSNTDNIDGPVTYLNKVEKYRPDVTVYTGRYFEVDGTLYRPFQLSPPDFKDLVERFLNSNNKEIYYTSDFPNDYGISRFGFYSAVNRNLPANRMEVVVNTAFMGFLETWSDQPQNSHPWNRMHYSLLKADYCELLLTSRKNRQNVQRTSQLDEMIDIACNNFQGLLNRIQFLLDFNSIDESSLMDLLKNAEDMRSQAISKREVARLEYLKGMYHLRINDRQMAKSEFKSSVKFWPHPDNPSNKVLITMRDTN